MKKKLLLAGLFLIFMSMSLSAQEKNKDTDNEAQTTAESQLTISHRVQMGETVMLICKKYLVAPDDIYKLNPDAVDGISQGMVLTLPAEKKIEAKPKKKQVTLGQAQLKSSHAKNR